MKWRLVPSRAVVVIGKGKAKIYTNRARPWEVSSFKYNTLSKAVLQSTFKGDGHRGGQRKKLFTEVKQWTGHPVPDLLTSEQDRWVAGLVNCQIRVKGCINNALTIVHLASGWGSVCPYLNQTLMLLPTGFLPLYDCSTLLFTHSIWLYQKGYLAYFLNMQISTSPHTLLRATNV